MAAIGCLLLVVLPLVCFVLGLFLAGTQGAIWSAVAGFVVALGIGGVALYALVKAGRR